MSSPGRVVHDPGAVLRDLIVMLVDGGVDFSAIEVLRSWANPLGEVTSDSISVATGQRSGWMTPGGPHGRRHGAVLKVITREDPVKISV